MAQQQADKAGAKQPATSNFQRLKDIEQHVIDAVDTAASVMEELSKLGPALDKAKVSQLCLAFSEKIQAAQALVQEGVEHPIADREFKATCYQPMTKVHMGHEKVITVAAQLARMHSTVQRGQLALQSAVPPQQQQQQQQQQPMEGIVEPEVGHTVAAAGGGDADMQWEDI